MTIEYLEGQLLKWKQVLLIAAGVGGTLFATAILDKPLCSSVSGGWFGLWLIVQLGVTPVGFMLIYSKGWRPLPLSTRLNTAFGYWTVAWIALAALSFRAGSTILGAMVFAFGMVLLLGYLWTHRARANTPEDMFP